MACTAQIELKHSRWGSISYFPPKEIDEYFAKLGKQCQFVGGGSWGDGYTNGVANSYSTYMVYDANRDDILLFKILYPDARVHVTEHDTV